MLNTNMRYYEIALLVSSELNKEQLKTFQEEINSLIQEEEGKVLVWVNELAKEKPTYQIKKGGRTHLITLNLRVQPGKLEVLEKKIKDKEEVLRYMILTKKEPRNAEIWRKAKFFPSSQVPQKKPGEVKKVELNEIEKKLEEILGE